MVGQIRREEMKEITIDNWIIGGSIFLLVFTVGCYFWFQHELALLDYDETYIETPSTQTSEIEQEELPKLQPTQTIQPDESDNNSSSISITTKNVS